MSDKLGKLGSGDGYRMKSITETVFFIPKNQIPSGRKATCANSVCVYETYHVQLTVWGDINI